MPVVSGEGTSSARILVIEAEAASLEDLRAVLARDGHLVQTARALSEAQLAVAETPPDVVLCGLPPQDTLDFCRWMKATEATRLVPVVVVAGAVPIEGKIDVLDAGAEDILVRPIHPLEVAARVRACVRLRRLTTALENAENVVFALATAIEQKDNYTEGHGSRVAIYARSLAEHVDPAVDGEVTVETSTVMHDRNSTPERAIVSTLLADGRRAWAGSTDPDVLSELITVETAGRRGTVDPEGTFTFA